MLAYIASVLPLLHINTRHCFETTHKVWAYLEMLEPFEILKRPSNMLPVYLNKGFGQFRNLFDVGSTQKITRELFRI